MNCPARYILAALVGWTIFCASALPAAAGEGASGALSLTAADGKVATLEVRHGYLFEEPDPFGGKASVRVLVLTDEDVRAKIEACDGGRCAELAAKNALVVKFWSDGSPPAYWAHLESTQYSDPLTGPGPDLEVDTPERIAGTVAIDNDSVRATISFDVSRLEVFTTLD
jgi:hypothetical protein